MKVDTTSATDWRQLREFSAVDLDKSFILSWHVESETLMIDVDLHLTPEHPFYEKPRPAEKVCIRPAIIEFPYCESLTTANNVSDSIVETAETLEHGAITGLQRHEDGRYEIIGEFGEVYVVAERPLLRLKGP
jgi:hypothetical protein